MSILIAHDFSGSTSGSAAYHELARKEYLAAKAEDPNTIILLWDTSYEVTTEDKYFAILDARRGRGGTEPSYVADYIVKNNYHGKLVLLTDGQTYDRSVEAATASLGFDWKFTRVEVHLVNTGGTVNMSVSCPFTRNSPHVVREYERDGTVNVSVDVSPEDLAAIEKVKTINNVKDYEANAEVLEKIVRARTMGTSGDPSLRDSILAMKKKIVEDASRSAGKDTSVEDMITAVKTSDVEKALELAGVVTSKYYAEMNTGWSSSINRLVGMCEGALKGAFDLSGANAAIQGDRARRADEAEEVDVATVRPTAPGTTPANFECPIMLENETDILLLVADDGQGPVLAGFDKNIVNQITDCPLNALNFPEVVDKIKAKLDHPISLKAAQEAVAANAPFNKSPMTQREVVGGIALGCNREQVKCTTAAIAKMVAEGKLLGSPDLWFAVIWRIIERGDIPHLAHLAESFRTQMKWRCENNSMFLSMSGLPELPTTRVPLGVSIWYVLSASALSLGGREEPIRAHLLHIDSLMQLNELTGYALPPKIKGHISRLRTLMGMLSACKKDRTRMPNVAKGMYQNMFVVDVNQISPAVKNLETVTEFIPLDGPATEASLAAVLNSVPRPWRSLSPKEIHALAKMVDPSLSAGDINLPYDFEEVAEEAWCEAEVEWAYGKSFDNIARVPICEVTCRPYYKVEPAHKEWKDVSLAHYGFPSTEQLPINRNYGDFVAKYRAYPNLHELLVFSYNRVIKGASGKTTLPCCAEKLARMVIEENEKAVTRKYSPAEFRRRYLDTTTVDKRLPVESGATPFVPVKPIEEEVKAEKKE